jgi:UDP-N-acetylmuramoyl-L-alanyl-D-glutamate--2,6-diaminopimelate ligase
MASLRPSASSGLMVSDIVSTWGLNRMGAKRDVLITGLELSSRDVRSGDLFAALPGAHHHGANYASEALANGAVAILTDPAGAHILSEADAPILVADSPRDLLGSVASAIYDSDDKARITFGVTGTNGKTSIVYCLSAILESLGLTTALSTTAQRRIGEREITSALTTPEAPELHSFMALAKESGARALALEVSAQAMTRQRVSGVKFDVVGFANLSHDHLDDYASFDDYFAAKRALFSSSIAARGVVCVDDEWGVALAKTADIPITTISARADTTADWHVEILVESIERTAFRVYSHEHSLESSVPVLGDFMALNAALALVMVVESGHSVSELTAAVGGDRGIPVYIPGRLEVVSGPVGPVFVVDYGHTPEAFRASLEALRRVTPGKVVMIFGADGDRDVLKRPELGAIAARLADTVIVTDYHPRSEDPSAIRSALLAGAHGARPEGDIREEPDPGSAVRLAISIAHSGDVILYAGPGHESYREQAGMKIPYNARDDVRTALTEAGYPTKDVL